MALLHRLAAQTLLLSSLGILATPRIARAAEKKSAPPARAAAEYPASDTQAKEHVTVAADPCGAPKDCSFFRLPYLQHGFLPIRVVFTNDSDRALSLDDVRIQFISANKDVIPAATLEDINRRLFSTRSTQGTRIPGLPIPITIHHQPVDKKVTDDDLDFGFPGTVVNAHQTLAGYLFYDVRDLDDPAAKGAEIYIKEVKTLDGKHELFAFTVPLDKWLAAQPKPAASKPASTTSSDDHDWHPDTDSKSK